MADNVPVTAGTGTTLATDDVSGVHYQRIKITDGTADAATNHLSVVAVGSLGAACIAPATYTPTSGTITTATSTITTGAILQAGNATVFLYGTHAGVNATFEWSPDNSNWFPVALMREDTGFSEYTTGILPANTVRAWSLGLPGGSYLRVRATAYTSGTANVVIAPGTNPIEPNVATYSNQMPQTLPQSSVVTASEVTLATTTGAKEVLTLFKAATTGNIYIYDIRMAVRTATTAGASVSELQYISAEGGTPGGTSLTAQRTDDRSASSVITARQVVTGAPTTAGQVFSRRNFTQNVVSYEHVAWQASSLNDAIRLRSGVAEGLRVTVNVTSALTGAPILHCLARWLEVA